MMHGDTEMRNHGGFLQVDIVQKIRMVPGYMEEIHIQAFLESQTVSFGHLQNVHLQGQ
jgi:hypothetical protein